MTASFAGQGLVGAAAALAIMLGADVGTSLVAQIFSLDVSWLSPVLIIAGSVLFHAGRTKRVRNMGRIGLGLGLMLLALALIVATSAPLRESAVLRSVVAALSGEPVLAVLVAAALTWLAHSSLATILLIVSFVAAGVASLDLAFALVLGANLGGAAGAQRHVASAASGPPGGDRQRYLQAHRGRSGAAVPGRSGPLDRRV
jgi:phosphate:Na+ symporter